MYAKVLIPFENKLEDPHMNAKEMLFNAMVGIYEDVTKMVTETGETICSRKRPYSLQPIHRPVFCRVVHQQSVPESLLYGP